MMQSIYELHQEVRIFIVFYEEGPNAFLAFIVQHIAGRMFIYVYSEIGAGVPKWLNQLLWPWESIHL